MTIQWDLPRCFGKRYDFNHAVCRDKCIHGAVGSLECLKAQQRKNLAEEINTTKDDL